MNAVPGGTDPRGTQAIGAAPALLPSLPGWTVPEFRLAPVVRRYSTVGDVLSYKRCRRQYGLNGVRAYASTALTQQYFGLLIHDALDRLHRDFVRSGGELPSLGDVRNTVFELHERLVLAGVRSGSARDQRDTVAKLVWRLSQLIGKAFFAGIIETELQLERGLQTSQGLEYVLTGVVDALTGPVYSALGLGEGHGAEIWDYKSASLGDEAHDTVTDTLADYEFQMLVYAELYRLQHGRFPQRCVLVFVSVLGDDRQWEASGGRLHHYAGKLFHVVVPDQHNVAAAMAEFQGTVELIEYERARPYAAQWAPPAHAVSEKTCKACDFRFCCPQYPAGLTERSQPF